MAILRYPKKPWLFGGPTVGRVRGRGPRSERGRTQCDGRKNDAGYFFTLTYEKILTDMEIRDDFALRNIASVNPPMRLTAPLLPGIGW